LALLLVGGGAVLADEAGVDARHGGDVLRALHAALELEAAHAHVDQLGHVGREVVVAQAERVSAVVGQAAGLGAQAAVAAALADDRAHRALARVAHTQRPVGEDLDLDGAARADLADLAAAELAGKHGARDAEPRRLDHAGERVYGHLRAGVERHVRHGAAQRVQHAPVLHQDRVHARRACAARDGGKGGQLAVVDDGVERQVDLDAVAVAVRRRVRQTVQREVVRVAAGVEIVHAEVDGVRAVLHGGDERLLRPGGGKQLGHVVTSFRFAA